MTVAEVEELDLSYAPPFAPVYDPILIAATVARKAAAVPGSARLARSSDNGYFAALFFTRDRVGIRGY